MTNEDTVWKGAARALLQRIGQLPGACLLVILGTLAAYSPCLFAPFDFHDSFYAFAYTNHHEAALHPQYAFFMFVGRPLYAWINQDFVVYWINSFEDTLVVRRIAIGVFALCAPVLYVAARQLRIPPVAAGLTAIALLVVPGLTFSTLLTQATPILYSLHICLLALACLYVCDLCLRRLGHGSWRQTGAKVLAAGGVWLLAVALLVATSLIYQQTSSLIFLAVAVAVLSSGHGSLNGVRRQAAVAVTAFGTHGLLYLQIHRNWSLPTFYGLTGQSPEQVADNERAIQMTADAWVKARFFLGEVVPRGFDVWFVGIPTMVALGLAVGWLALAIAWSVKVSRREDASVSWLGAGERVAWLLATCVLLNAPNLMAQGNMAAYRHVVPFQWFVVITTILFTAQLWEFEERRGPGWRLACGALVVGIAFSSFNLYRNGVLPLRLEFAHIRERVESTRGRSGPVRVGVVSPDIPHCGRFCRLEGVGGEFGKMTTMYWQDVPWIVHAASQSAGFEREYLGEIRTVEPGEELHDFDLVIDMRPVARGVRGLRTGFGVSGSIANGQPLGLERPLRIAEERQPSQSL